MLNRPKARTRGYSCPLDENVARSILHKTIAIESKSFTKAIKRPRMKPTRGSESKANPNRKMDQAQLQALSGSGSKENPSQHPKGVDQAQRAKRICPQPAAAPRVQRAKRIRTQRPRGVDEARGMRQYISERCPGECSRFESTKNSLMTMLSA